MSSFSLIMGAILVPAFGVAFSPSVVLNISSFFGRQKNLASAVAYLLGWIFSLTLLFWLTFLIFNSLGASDIITKTALSRLLYLVLGIILILLSLQEIISQLRSKKTASPKSLPFSEFTLNAQTTPLQAALFSLTQIFLNPKNLILIIATSSAICRYSFSPQNNINAWLLFTLFSSILFIILTFLLSQNNKATNKAFNHFQNWLTQNQSTILFVLNFVIGLNFIASGI